MEALFNKFKDIKVAVLGDVMLDTYWWGNVERISPEAPVPVVSMHHKEYRIGGAGNVAINLAALGAKTTVFSVLGNDEDGTILKKLLETNNINTSQIIDSPKRITTNKTRVVCRNQQLMRIDNETTEDLTSDIEDRIFNAIETYISHETPSILIFEDYNKGVLTENLITKVIALCKKNNVLTAVDPKKKNFFAFKGVDIFKPNLKEVKEGLNITLEEVNLNSMKEVHVLLQKILNHTISFITLSEKGVFYNAPTLSNIIPCHVRNIADVSGAGDTVIAVTALVYATTKDIHLASAMGNIAGGLVCEEVGTAAINKEKLFNECKQLLR